MLNRFIMFAVICFACVPHIVAQKKNRKIKIPKQIQIKTNLMILDSKKQHVNGVKAQDIKPFEDGVEQKINYFEEKKPTLNLGILVDNTGSMKPSLGELIWSSIFITQNLQKKDEAFLVRFVDSSKIEVVQDWTSDKTLLTKGLKSLYIEGGQSAVLDALYLSAQKINQRTKEDSNKTYAILLISDVEERASYYNYRNTIKLLKDTDCQVFVLSYAKKAKIKKKLTKRAKILSHLLSLETGGTTYTLNEKHTPEELKEIVKKIILELRSNYIIGYTPTNQKKDGLPRKITVKFGDSEKATNQIIVRDNYIVPSKK